MKIMIGLLAAAILGTGGFAFAAGVDDSQPARTVSLPGATTSGDTATGTTTAATTAAATTDDIVIGNAPAATTNGVDISGPCDEAEHANDPRCTGAAGDDGDDDNSGPGSGDDNDDSSGHGSGHDDDDNSGHGSGHDNDDD
jgi:hypothetical protein